MKTIRQEGKICLGKGKNFCLIAAPLSGFKIMAKGFPIFYHIFFQG